MSQQGMTIVSASIDEERRLSDIEYLAVQQFNDNLIRLEGDINDLASKLTHTVSLGKDAYIMVAKITPTGFTAPTSNAVANNSQTTTAFNHVEAKISTGQSGSLTELDRAQVGMATRASSQSSASSRFGNGNGTGYGHMSPVSFDAAIGAKATTGQLIEIENTVDNGNCKAQLVILEVDSGTSPAL